MPKLHNGINDQWRALIDLQGEAQDHRERNKKLKETEKKRAYLNLLKDEIDKKKTNKGAIENQKLLDALRVQE